MWCTWSAGSNGERVSSLSERNSYELWVEIVARLDHLETALLLLAKHVGAVGWNYELQKALDAIRDDLRLETNDRPTRS